MNLKIGQVISYYGGIKMAVVELTAPLAVGEKISFESEDSEPLVISVASLQIEHRQVESAKKGDIVSIAVEGNIKNGTEVFKI